MHLDPSFAQANRRVQAGETVEADVNGRHGSARPQHAILLLEPANNFRIPRAHWFERTAFFTEDRDASPLGDSPPGEGGGQGPGRAGKSGRRRWDATLRLRPAGTPLPPRIRKYDILLSLRNRSPYLRQNQPVTGKGDKINNLAPPCRPGNSRFGTESKTARLGQQPGRPYLYFYFSRWRKLSASYFLMVAGLGRRRSHGRD